MLILGSVAAAFILMDAIASHGIWATVAAPRWVVFGVGIALAMAGFAPRLGAICSLSFSSVLGSSTCCKSGSMPIQDAPARRHIQSCGPLSHRTLHLDRRGFLARREQYASPVKRVGG
jgi:hypothetical protein